MLSTGGIIPCLPFFCKGVSAPLVMHAVWCTVFRRGVALEENVESREPVGLSSYFCSGMLNHVAPVSSPNQTANINLS